MAGIVGKETNPSSLEGSGLASLNQARVLTVASGGRNVRKGKASHRGHRGHGGGDWH